MTKTPLPLSSVKLSKTDPTLVWNLWPKMDIKNVSDVSDSVAFMKQLQDKAERASRRKGQMVRDHPPPKQLVSNFMKLLASTIHSGPMDNTIATSQVPTLTPLVLVPSASSDPL